MRTRPSNAACGVECSSERRERDLLLALVAAPARIRLAAELSREPDPVRRSDDEKQISLSALAAALDAAGARTTAAFDRLRTTWFERLLGPDRATEPTSAHTAWMRRLSPLEATYPKERCVPVCVATLHALGFDIEASAVSSSTSRIVRRSRLVPA